MDAKKRKLRRALTTGALVVGAAVGAAGIAGAATSSSAGSSSTSTTAPPGSTGAPPSGAPTGTMPSGAPSGTDPATVAHGPNETLLTGSDLQKADAAADAVEPGATVIRAETDSSGASSYEVHMRKSDGSIVTVELNSDFTVKGTTSGFGPGPAGSPPPGAPGSSRSPSA